MQRPSVRARVRPNDGHVRGRVLPCGALKARSVSRGHPCTFLDLWGAGVWLRVGGMREDGGRRARVSPWCVVAFAPVSKD